MRPVSLRLAVIVAAVLMSLLPGCRPKNTGPPSVTIDSPAHGEFVTGSQVTVTGTISGALGQIAELRINGLLVITFGQPNYSFPIGIGPSEIFKPIVVELTRLDGSVVRRRVTVIHGDSVADGGFSPMGVAMRLNDSGLDDVEPTVRQGLEGFLDDPDGSGPQDGPIGDAIEVALAGIEISGPIGQAIGVNLETPLFDVFEDVDGITLDSDARITASQPAPGAVDLRASYHIAEPFPVFGPNTPAGGLPYDLGLCISTSAFNQLLKAEVESGLLLSSLTELDIGFGLTPLTAGFLATVIPAFGGLDPTLPMRIDIAPTLGPVVTGADGPQGELAELRIGHLLVSLVVDSSGFPLLEVAVDATVGLDIAFTNGELSFTPGPLASNDVGLTILTNPLAANESPLQSLLLILIPQLFPTLADSLGSFPLPGFLGLQLDSVEVSKNGEFMSLFVDLSTVP